MSQPHNSLRALVNHHGQKADVKPYGEQQNINDSSAQIKGQQTPGKEIGDKRRRSDIVEIIGRESHGAGRYYQGGGNKRKDFEDAGMRVMVNGVYAYAQHQQQSGGKAQLKACSGNLQRVEQHYYESGGKDSVDRCVASLYHKSAQ